MEVIPLLISLVDAIFWVIYFALFARIILSWFPMKNNQLVDILFQMTEPILAPVRMLLKKTPLGSGMMIDLSPIFTFILLRVIVEFIKNFLRSLL